MVSGALIGIMYGFIAVGFILIAKATGNYNLAQGELVMLGAFLAWTGLQLLNLPFYLTILWLFVCSIVIGTLIGNFLLRPLTGQPILALVMMTIALSLLLNGAAIGIWGADFRTLPELFHVKLIKLGNIELPTSLIAGSAVSILLVVSLLILFRYAKVGLAMKAAAEDHRIAQSLGISVDKITVIVWIISCFLAAMGGLF
jgi:branched-chain amino acid transport system permease protein